MPAFNRGLSTRSLAELSLVVSRVARSVLDESAFPNAAALQSFWQSCRSLEKRWTRTLNEWTSSGTLDLDQLEQLAPRVFTCEMLVRNWSTILAGLDARRESNDQTIVARNAVSGLLQVRNGILSRLLLIPSIHHFRVLDLDRLRRRCDRWTDLLIGPLAARCQCFEFAFDRERARDFGEEGMLTDPVSVPHAVEHLVSAGLRLTFMQHFTSDELDEPEFVDLTQSILSSIPERAFHRDGSLRTLLEQRIAVSRMRMETRATFSLAPRDVGETDGSTMTMGGNLFNRRILE